MNRFLISGHAVTGDSNGFVLLLTHMDCGDSLLSGYAGGAPTLRMICRQAEDHVCHQGQWRQFTAEELAAL